MAATKIAYLLTTLIFFRNVPAVTASQAICEDYFKFSCDAGNGFNGSKFINTENLNELRDYFENKLYYKKYVFAGSCPEQDYLETLKKQVNNIVRHLDQRVKSLEAQSFHTENKKLHCLLRFDIESDDNTLQDLAATMDQIFKEAMEDYKKAGPATLKAAQNSLNHQKNPKNVEEYEDYIKKLFMVRHPVTELHDAPLYKSKLLYKKCHRDPNEGDTNGLLALTKEIDGILKSARALFLNKKAAPIKCGQGQNSEGCKEFSAALAALHEYSAAPLFAIRPLDLLPTSINSNKRVGAIMSPPFVGDYDAKIRFDDCDIDSAEDVDFNGTAFEDLARGKDQQALEQFGLLSNLAGLDRTQEQLMNIVAFEKKLFKFAPDREVLSSPEKADKVASFVATAKFHAAFSHVVDQGAYHRRLRRHLAPEKNRTGAEPGRRISEGERAIEGLGGVVLLCKAYFFGLNEAMKNTPAETVLDYVQLATLYHFAREYPGVLSAKDRSTMGLSEAGDSGDCYELTMSLYPQITNRIVWRRAGTRDGDMLRRAAVIDKLLKTMAADFEKMVAANRWLGPEAKAFALRKVRSLPRVVGEPPEKTARSDFAGLFRFAEVRPTFAETLASALRNGHIVAMRTLFDGNAEYDMRSVPMHPHGSPHVRDNRLVVNPGLVTPPFVKDGAEAMDDYASFGFVIGREMAQAIGVNGVLFDLRTVFNQLPDEETQNHYGQKLKKLEALETKVCAGSRSVFRFFRGAHQEATFENVRDEVIGDFGGFRLALSGYQGLVSEADYADYADDFVRAVAEYFCAEALLKRDSATHPTDKCRVNLLAQTTHFNNIFKCTTHIDEQIDWW